MQVSCQIHRASGRSSGWIAGALAASILLLGIPEVHGQQVSGSATEPGKLERRITPPAPLRRPVDRIAPAPPEKPAAEVEERKFVLTGVEVVGSTVYQPAAFSLLYDRYLGQEISLAEVENIVAAVTKMYRDDGYVLSRAVAPPQALEFGVLRIRAIEGYVDRLVLEGDMSAQTSLVTGYSRKISDDRPLRQSVLERYVLLMSDIPGLDVEPSLKQTDPERGAYQLVLTIKRDPVDVIASIDNRGTHPVGPLQVLFGGDVNGALGYDERTRLLAFVVPDEPEELRFFELSHDLPIGGEGTRATLSASRSAVDIFSESSGAPQRGDNRRFGLKVSYPMLRARKLTLRLHGAYDHIRSAQEALDDDFVDRLRVLRAGAEFEFEDGIGGPSTIGLEVSQGFDILDASVRGDAGISRTDGTGEFTKLTLELSRQQKLFDGFALQLEGQVSADTLLSSEEFSIGGSQFGRAFDPSEVSGTHGAAGAVELQYGVKTGLPFFKSFTLYGFYDAGAVWAEDGESTPLTSAGAGVRLNPVEGLLASLELAKPLNRIVAEEGDDDLRFFFSLFAQF